MQQQWRFLGHRCVSSTARKSAAPVTIDTVAKSVGISAQLGVYDELSKSKLSALVVMTTGAGFLMAGGPISWSSFTAACVGTSLAASSANTFNQVWERHRDKLMNRTFQRPLPSGRISTSHALAWGTTTGIASTAILAAGCNPLTAALGAFNIGLYSLVYTPMKTRSEFNTWVGSIVGAIPPVMGWAAATGSMIAPESLLAASILYLWQFPHFFALSWRLRKDYARGGFQMVPCADPTGQRTAELVMRYSTYLLPVSIVASMTGVTSSMFAVEGVAMSSYLLYLSSQFKQHPNNANAKKVFLCSLWYLPALLGCMVFHSQNWLTDEEKTKAALLDGTFLDTYGPQNVADRVRQTRDRLKQVCVHEYLWNSTSSSKKHTDAANRTSSSLLCPSVAKDIATETIISTTATATATATSSSASLTK